MTEILKSIDVTGETTLGEAFTHAEVVRTRYGTIGIEYHTRYSSGGRDPFKTVEDAEAAIRSQFDSYIAPRDSTQLAAIAALEKWGQFCSGHDELVAIAGKKRGADWNDRDKVKMLLKQTDRRAAKQLANIPANIAGGDSGMSDAQVAAAIRFLTGRDADHAELPNHEGWNAGHSSKGHFAYAMLSQDYPAAIAMGRTLIGKYQRQLAMAGII